MIKWVLITGTYSPLSSSYETDSFSSVVLLVAAWAAPIVNGAQASAMKRDFFIVNLSKLEGAKLNLAMD